MKKLLSLFVLLVAIVTGAKAADYVDTYGALGTVTGNYIADGISKITLGDNATANSGIQATSNGATLKFTVSTPTGFTIKTVKFKDSDVNESNISCNDATGTLSTSDHYTTLTASADKTSIEFTVPSSASGKKAKLTEFVVTVSSSANDDYELITPQSISSNVITYTSSLGDNKLVTAMGGVGGPSCSAANLNFGNGKGFTLTTSRPIKAVYCVWYQRCPMSNTGWQGYSDAEATTVTGSYSVETNAWEAPDAETTFVAFKSSEGSTHKIAQIHIFYYPSATPTGYSLDGVKINGSTATETTDYTISDKTITLTNSYVVAPTIALIEKTTYETGDPTTKDVAVTLTKSGTYFEGEATIGKETLASTYTVKVPVDVTPTLEADQTALTVTSPKIVTGTATFNLTGANLAGENVTLAFASAVEGLTVSPASIAIAEGSVEQTVTVSYVSTEVVAETVVNLVVSTDGVSDITIPVTYSSTAATVYTQEDVTEAATWDWSKYGTSEIKLTAETPLKKTDEFLLASIDNYGYNAPAAAFGNAKQLLMTTEYVVRDSKYWQGGSIKFNTTVPGEITVVYSNTGNRTDEDDRRFLNVNGTNYGEGTMSSKEADKVTTSAPVAVGEVEIKGTLKKDGSDQYLRIYSIEFTPATTETITIPSDGVLTYVTTNALDFSSVNGAFTAYVPTGVNTAKTKVNTAEVTTVPAGTALLLKGAAGIYNVNIVASAEEPEANIFQVSNGSVTGGDNIFAYSKSALKFKKVASTVTIPAGKCYLTIAGVSGDALDLDFDGEATAVDAIAEASEAEAAPVKVIKNGKLYIGNFNVAGQQVK